MWVQNGDLIFNFFHNSAHIHKHKNFISHIIDARGMVYSNRVDTKQFFLNHYFDLWKEDERSSVLDIFNALPCNFNTIYESNKELLIKPMTKTKIYRALWSFSSKKNPGPDRFNVDFYRVFWNVIGNQFFDEINYFFSSFFP